MSYDWDELDDDFSWIQLETIEEFLNKQDDKQCLACYFKPCRCLGKNADLTDK